MTRGAPLQQPSSVPRRTDVTQTLARGLDVLFAIGEHPGGLSTAELAKILGVSRAIIYRLVRTLQAYNLISRKRDKRYVLGLEVLKLVQFVRGDLRWIARPILEDLAETTCATANLTLVEGDEVVVLEVVEPNNADFHVAYKVGQRHSIRRGSAGQAILMTRPPHADDPEPVNEGRRRGYATSFGEVIPGVIGVSAPITAMTGGAGASIGVSVLRNDDIRRVAGPVMEAARKIDAALGERGPYSPPAGDSQKSGLESLQQVEG